MTVSFLYWGVREQVITPELQPSLGSANPSCLWGMFSSRRLIMGVLPTGLHSPERWEREGFPLHVSRRKRKLGQVSCPGFSVSIWQMGLTQASGLSSENSFCLLVLLGLDCLTPASLAFCSGEALWLVKLGQGTFGFFRPEKVKQPLLVLVTSSLPQIACLLYGPSLHPQLPTPIRAPVNALHSPWTAHFLWAPATSMTFPHNFHS